MSEQTIELEPNTITALVNAQRNEITESIIYERLANKIKDPHNSDILRAIAKDERSHAAFYRHYTGQDVKPCLLYTSPSPRDRTRSRMPSSA